MMQFFVCLSFLLATQAALEAQRQPSDKAAMLPSTAFPLKDFGRFIKKNKADFSKLPHDSFKPWPSSALCHARVRAGCLPLCTRYFSGAIIPLQSESVHAARPPPQPREESQKTCTTAKSPQVCDRSERFSCRLHIQ